MLKRLSILFGILCLSPINSQAQRFVAIGDFGVNDTNELAVSQLVKSLNPDFIISTGDNNYPKGEQSTIDGAIGKYYQEYIHPYVGNYGPGADSNMFWPSPGNHDYDTPGATPYYNYFQLPGNERYYDFVKGDVHFFSLNSNIEEPDGIDSAGAQAQWLKNKLSQSSSKWKVVYMHHAPYGSVGHGNSPIHQWPFQEWGADVVITGHNHTYERLEVDGFPYFVVGCGGRRLHNIYFTILQSQVIHKTFGAMLVQAFPDSLRFEFHSVDQGILDTYTLNPSSQALETKVIRGIQNGDDDVEENEFTGVLYTHSSDLELGHDTPGNQGCQVVGLRFNGIKVPKGAIIKQAILQVISDQPGTGSHEVEITGAMDPDFSAFDTTVAFYLTNFPKTSQAISWSLPTFYGSKEAHQSPDLTVLVQEIIDQSQWSYGNSLGLFISHIDGSREVESFEGKAGSAPQLLIEYELPALVQVSESFISHGSHDVEENETSGQVYMNSSDIELGFDSYNQQNYQISGYRFESVTVPKNAQIVQAYLEWTVETPRSGNCQLKAWAEKSANPLPFSTNGNFNLANRPRTQELQFGLPTWSQSGAKKQSVDLSAQVQEIIDLSNWQELNPMHFYFKGLVGTRESYSFENNPAKSARLVIHYTSSQPQQDLFASINKGSNDVEESESSGALYTSSSDLELGYDAYNGQNYQTLGLRYENLGIPQGAFIQSAHLDFTVDQATGSISNLTIHGEKSGNSSPFDAQDFQEVSGRPKTSEIIHWSPPAWYPVGSIQSSPDLSHIVQEIVDQNTWTPGNALSFILKGSSGTREAESYESGAHLAPKLRITYSLYNPNRTQPEALSSTLIPENPLDQALLFPNPNTGNLGHIKLVQPIEGRWYFVANNLLGQELNQKVFDFDGGVQQIDFEIDQWPSGVYEISIYNAFHKKTFQLVIP